MGPGDSTSGRHPTGRSSLSRPAIGFELALARLRVRIESACAAQPSADWPARLLAGIRAGLAFAAADPAAANRLTNDTRDTGATGEERHERLIAYLVECLRPGRELSGADRPLPDDVERVIAGRIVALVGDRLARGCEDELLMAGGEEAIELALAPYVGSAAARRLARG
jgi:hypothetical protein